MGSSEVVEERGNWSKKMDFMLSCIGFAVGLGNVWRFPYLCYRNGGASFLIPYVIMLVLAGLPLFFLELALGQFASEGPITVWKISPAFSGIGFAMITISGMVCIYYNVIIMYSIYYMFVSFVNLDDKVPWETCGNNWNTDNCRRDPYPFLDSMNESYRVDTLYDELYNQSCVQNLKLNISNAFNMTMAAMPDVLNSTMIEHKVTDECKITYTSSTEEYWTRYVLRLHEADGFDDMGGFSLKNTICLFLAWILVFFCLMKGIKSSGKVVYFTATFPYFILIVLLVRGLTLPGYMKGIEFYMIPKVEKLKDPKVWGDAATQIFYSLGPAWGGLLTMSSYNKFRNNCHRDAVIVALINCGTSIFAGFAIFSLLGFMSHTINRPIDQVVAQGPGLAFIAYPEGISRLPVSPVWAFLFFFMLLTLGLDSQFVMMETVISAISDVFPRVLRKRKALFTLFCCMVGFVLGLPQTTKGGIYMLTLMDWYSGSYNLMLVALAEIICIMYVYGFKKFMCDVEMMIGYKPNPYWLVNWLVLTPVVILFIVIMSATQYTPAYYGDYEFPEWAQALGWCMVVAPLAWIILIMIIQVVRLGPAKAFRSTPDWGPANPEDRTGRYATTFAVYDNQKQVPYLVPENDMVKKPLPYTNGGTDNSAYFNERL